MLRRALVLLALPLFVVACDGTDPSRSQICGDGILADGEECDDGNDSNADHCLTSCLLATCGDGYLFAAYEECDEGAANGDDAACTSSCRDAYCGDGLTGPGEACDDGNKSDTDACTNACAVATCGDGIVADTEECDDTNSANGDGCTSACDVEEHWACSPAGCECVPGHFGSACADCAPGWQDADGDGSCESDCDLFETTGQCDLSVSHCELDDGVPSCACNDGFFDLGSGCVELEPCMVFVSVGGSGDGSSWQAAGGEIQAAITSAAALAATRPDGFCDVWVSEGTYTVYEGAITDTIALAPGVKLIGGFAGTESSADERDIDAVSGLAAHESILDGLGVRHAVTGASNAWIDGFVITGAEALGTGSDEEGQGAGLYAVDAEGLVVASMYFHDLAAARDGGAIHVTGGDLTVRTSRFASNRSNNYGGAIGAWGSTSLVLEDSWFEGNAAQAKHGGAVFAHEVGDLVVDGSTFFENTARHDGGGLWAAGGATATVVGSRFVDNVVGSSSPNGCLGGGAVIRGHNLNDVDFGIASNLSRMDALTVVDTDFVGNQSGMEGGGLYVYAIDALDVAQSTFTENETGIGGPDSYSYQGGLGGGLAAYDLGDASLSWTVFDDNWSGWNGAGAMIDGADSVRVDHGSFTDNSSSSGHGGGLWIDEGGDVTLVEAVFSGNLAKSGGAGAYLTTFDSFDASGGAFDDNAQTDGSVTGALALWGGSTRQGTVAIDGAVFRRNWSPGGASSLTVHNVESASVRRGVFWGNSTADVALDGYTNNGTVAFRAVSAISLRDTRFEGNGMTEGSSGAPGGMLATYFDTLSLSGVEFIDNLGNVGGLWACGSCSMFDHPRGNDTAHTWTRDITFDDVVFDGNYGYHTGGARLEQLGDVQIANARFDDNYTDTQGGGLTLRQATAARIESSTGSGNISWDTGGGTFAGAGDGGVFAIEQVDTLELVDLVFDDNLSGYVGGTMSLVSNGAVSFERVHVSESSGDNTGGAIHVNGVDSVVFDQSSIRSSSSAGTVTAAMGAGLFVDGADQITVSRSFFASNALAEDHTGYEFYGGGALAFHNADAVLVEDSIFDGNVVSPSAPSSQHGGALSVRPAAGTTPTIEIIGCTFVNDDAPRATSVAIDRQLVGDSADVTVTVKNTIAWDQNGDVPMRHFYASYYYSDHPDGIAYSFSDIEGQTASGNVFAEDPQFQASSESDAYQKYRLSEASNLKAAGTPITGAVDFEGNTRNASAPAIGALEFAATAR